MGRGVERVALTVGCVGLLVVAIAGCTAAPAASDADSPAQSQPAVSQPADPPAASPSPPVETATECVDGTWNADLDGLIGQQAQQLSATGLDVTSADATGSQTLSIGREGVLGFDADMTFVLAVDMAGGLTMTMTQTHTGVLSANWEWSDDATADGGTIRFSDFDDSGYDVQTAIDINGQSAESPFPPPSVAAADVPTVVTCDGNTLTTHPEGSPFTTTWTRG
ncbi:hypothetical protein [Microbacterium sp. NPDC058389]|uniref:hypothetical protein n=1 Tax=Microbacterium sp. NPDC058389 TaxID=3346475 RepID=UPI003660C282